MFEEKRYELFCGDCLDYLHLLPPDSAIVTDPPYGRSTNTAYLMSSAVTDKVHAAIALAAEEA